MALTKEEWKDRMPVEQRRGHVMPREQTQTRAFVRLKDGSGSIGPMRMTGRKKQILVFIDRDGYVIEILAHFLNDKSAERFEELLLHGDRRGKHD